LPYEIDGMVIKVNSIALQDKMGMTTHHPRWAIAFKFKARQATSILRKVEFQVGRTGSITPVAKIDPVPLSGVTVGSVSLFNEDVVREKDLRIGDHVLVERAGDVIPYIVKPLAELRTGKGNGHRLSLRTARYAGIIRWKSRRRSRLALCQYQLSGPGGRTDHPFCQ
jgi:DNA ligase (NAD+)